MRLLLLIPFLISFQFLVSQVATVQDPDGWTNVRSEATLDSEVIYRVKEGYLFWTEYEIVDENAEWLLVFIPLDKFTTKGYESDFITGFIHKSRVVSLTELEKYKGDDFSFEYSIQEFDPSGRTITYEKGEWPIAIDGKFIWGTDGIYPNEEVKSIKIQLGGKSIPVPEDLYNDLFEVRKDLSIYKINDQFIVYNWNSDGAGYYELAWLISEKGIIQRLVGSRY